MCIHYDDLEIMCEHAGVDVPSLARMMQAGVTVTELDRPAEVSWEELGRLAGLLCDICLDYP